jgi:uncharacterized membrane protein
MTPKLLPSEYVHLENPAPRASVRITLAPSRRLTIVSAPVIDHGALDSASTYARDMELLARLSAILAIASFALMISLSFFSFLN